MCFNRYELRLDVQFTETIFVQRCHADEVVADKRYVNIRPFMLAIFGKRTKKERPLDFDSFGPNSFQVVFGCFYSN